MARVRFIKPGFFTNDTLAEVHPLGRLLFQGLWCIADRAGRLEDRPKRIKAEVLPYDNADVDALLDALAARGFILRYAVGDARYIQVVNFVKHQTPHIKEQASVIPASDMSDAKLILAPPVTDPVTYTDPYTVTDPSSPLHDAADSEHDVVTDASASSRGDDFFTEDDDLSFLDEEQEPETTPARTQAQPANITALPVTSAPVATPSKPKQIPKERATWDDDSEPMRLACYLKAKLLAVNPDVRVPANLTSWCSDFDKALRIDKRTYDGLKQVIDFATTDSFWSTNILSAGKLRIQYAQLAGKMRNHQQRNGENYHNGHDSSHAGLAQRSDRPQGENRGDASQKQGEPTAEQRALQRKYAEQYGYAHRLDKTNAAS